MANDFGFEIDIRGMTTDKLDDFTKRVVPKIVSQSLVSAMNTTARTIRARSIRAISNASGIKPQKLIRGRFGIHKANRKKLATGVYFRFAPVPAEIVVGKAGVKWNPKMKGAKAKGRTYEGAFAATPRSGKHAGKRQRIYKRVSRTGSNRTDLRAQYIHIEKYAPILKTVGERVVRQKLEQTFANQFNWRMEKAGY